MKVLQVCTSRSWGGMEMHVGDIASALTQTGIESAAICAPDSRLERNLRQKSIPCHTMKAGGYVRPFAIGRAITILREMAPTVIHVHYSKDLWWLVPALLFVKAVPVLLSKHIGTQKPKRDPLHRFLYNRLQYVIAISGVIRDNIIATHPISPEKVVVVHHGVDLTRYNPAAIQRHQQRQKLGYTDREFVLGIIGRLQAGKGYFEFLEMAEALRRHYPICRFLLIGEASRGEESEAQKILQQIEAAGLQEVVQWCGFRKDIPELLCAMDVFVFPSHAEAFGLVLIEAMAMAKPVISSNCDGVLDIVVDGESGVLTAPRDVRALTAAARKLIDDAHLRARLGRNARLRIEQKFTAEKMIQKIRELYMQAVNEL